MKWNWGTKIALVFAAFCGFMIFLVVTTFQQDVSLVTEEYYKEELTYQRRIDEISNAAALGYEVEIRQGKEFVEALFPAEAAVTGEIHFYRPDNSKLDRKFDFSGNARIEKAALASGRYKLKISWNDSSGDYFTEKEIFITR